MTQPVSRNVQSSDNRWLARCAAMLAVSVALMFVGHLLAWAGSSVSPSFRLPYWWSYVILFPAAGFAAVRLSPANWRDAAVCLCATPILYFVALGVFDGTWMASDGALWGALVAFVLTAIVAFLAKGKPVS